LTSRNSEGKSGTLSPGFVILSGLPASGKSRLGAALAPLLGLALLDKDDFLEAMFEREGVGDTSWRERLSRESDDQFCAAAIKTGGAVLTSYWRHPGRADGGGTPSDWLRALPGSLVEVHCHCPTAIALERFRRRTRHPGHLDAKRPEADLTVKFEDYAARGPLGLGMVIPVDTTDFPAPEILATRIRRVLGACSG
jgi:shikimate kinase